ncbi:MAG: hypothetical protein P8Z49_03640 [Acidobacteriota bacterium]
MGMKAKISILTAAAALLLLVIPGLRAQACDPPPNPCPPEIHVIYAGQAIPAGNVSVWNDSANLYIQATASSPCMICELHIYAGLDPVPTNNAGAPQPGQFPYKFNFSPEVATYTLQVPLAALNVGCDDTLNAAVHLAMVHYEDGPIVQEETGWAYGPYTFDKSWGWWFTYTICCEETPPPGGNCTLTQGFWKNHAGYWPLSTETELCGLSWMTIFQTQPEGEAWYILAHQWIAATLNVANGADSTVIAEALSQAEAILTGNCLSVPESLRGQAIDLSETLDHYNNGTIGPGHCDY